MTPPHPDSEAALELDTIALFQQLGYTTAYIRESGRRRTSDC